MHVCVLGAAAGGGFPQWNAGGVAQDRARAGDPAAPPASQASIAISADGRRWVLVNASPDIRQQIEDNPPLWPRDPPRSSPIAAVVLTNADVDAVAGLLSLREGTAFALYAHPKVLDVLDRNPIFEVVDRGKVPRRPLALGRPEALADAADRALNVTLTPFAAPGKVPLWQEGNVSGEIDTAATNGEALGLEVATPAGRLVYLANCAAITAAVRERVAGAALLFMDGTLWQDDELVTAGVSTKTGRRMGHVSMAGPDGAVERLADLAIGRRIFIHVNNSNPALLADSPERAALTRAGWEVAADGMEIVL